MVITEKNHRWYDKMLQNRNCICCGSPAEVKADGTCYQYCNTHRLAQNNRMRMRNAAKRAAARTAVPGAAPGPTPLTI